MQTGPRTAATMLAVVYGVSGLLCWFSAAAPMDDATPVGLLWALGGIGLAAGAALRSAAGRLPSWVLHAGVALLSVLVGVVAWRAATAVGVVGLGPALIAVSLYAAHFFPLRVARAHAALALVSGSAGAWAAAPSDFVSPWIAVVVSVVVLTEVQGRLARQLCRAAATDPLTGVANRRAWEEQAAGHLSRAARTGEPLTFAILDLDDFKEVNDRDGHGAGDDLLRELTASWRRRLRRADVLGRYGGDEFVLCLPATDEDAAWQLMAALAETHPFTWTAGVAAAAPGDELATVLARADAQLYRRKRNRLA
ncbi:GGDEF domain-containing protein [Blastococcus sp. MG754426]|uniref:GGDEF domain-containing protein n=1 Tax=unclassified Blastococcus TaxID=2619396 RepID=UPI001EF15DDC|nr:MULTISPECIES: GGDEF domain-containing protein [unclassified Blastococcus]MCF6508085.1 GGDEF domain-containing protein [Blastococcus sp. MG754426]MCF6511587.1 GGDEF domain-containing protein [Blastococcus sp. MG754427]MCF6733750.1 GGDEF domain-containing protein [Blastococcus sp. KM273129]